MGANREVMLIITAACILSMIFLPRFFENYGSSLSNTKTPKAMRIISTGQVNTPGADKSNGRQITYSDVTPASLGGVGDHLATTERNYRAFSDPVESTEPTTRVTTNSSDRNIRRIRYLLAIRTTFNGGAGAQYNMFKSAFLFSLLTNRTLVMTPFLFHHVHVQGGFRPDDLRSFESTFDAEVLEDLLPLATVDQFTRVCHADNTKMIGWNIRESQYEYMRESFYRNLTGIDLPKFDTVIDLKDDTKVDKLISKSRPFECLALSVDRLAHVNFGDRSTDELKTAMDKYLVRSPLVKDAVSDLSGDICKGREYLAVHWRNKSAEVPCDVYRHQGNYGHLCEGIKTQVRELAHLAAEAISDLMTKEGIACVYVSCPFWSMEFVDILSRYVKKGHINSSRSLNIPDEYEAVTEEYMFQLVEQEIMFRAAIFIAASHSNWSDFILKGREAIGRKTYGIRELAQIPEDVELNMI